MNRAKQYKPEDCPEKPHRGPQGPNEDLSQCRMGDCWLIFWVLRVLLAFLPIGRV